MKAIDPLDASRSGEDLEDPGHINIDMRMSIENFRSLERLARATNSTLEEVVAKAFILYQ